jgi:hypothetical protein
VFGRRCVLSASDRTGERAGAALSPRCKRHAPTCCDDNALRGYVLATSVYSEPCDNLIYGESWVFVITDATGLVREVPTDRCPLCKAHLRGIPHVEVDAWRSGEDDKELRSNIYKAQAALNELRKKDEES